MTTPSAPSTVPKPVIALLGKLATPVMENVPVSTAQMILDAPTPELMVMLCASPQNAKTAQPLLPHKRALLTLSAPPEPPIPVKQLTKPDPAMHLNA